MYLGFSRANPFDWRTLSQEQRETLATKIAEHRGVADLEIDPTDPVDLLALGHITRTFMNNK